MAGMPYFAARQASVAIRVITVLDEMADARATVRFDFHDKEQAYDDRRAI